MLGHVTAALASAVPALDSMPINKLTNDMQSFVFDGAVRSFRSDVTYFLPTVERTFLSMVGVFVYIVSCGRFVYIV